MSKVIKNIANQSSREYSTANRHAKESIDQNPRSKTQQSHEDGRHHETVVIHWNQMMNSMQKKMQRQSSLMIGEFSINMENESVENIFDQSPSKQPKHLDSNKCRTTQGFTSH